MLTAGGRADERATQYPDASDAPDVWAVDLEATAVVMHIDVGSVLRGSVCELYSNLLTRPTGAAVRTAIEQQVAEIAMPMVTSIDFSQVNLLDFSCADEIVAKLLLRFARDEGPRCYITFRGIHDGHIDPIETVLERHSLALVSWHGGVAELFGHVDASERFFWEAVRDHGPLSASAASVVTSKPLEESERQLDHLVSRRLLMFAEIGYAVPGMPTGRENS